MWGDSQNFPRLRVSNSVKRVEFEGKTRPGFSYEDRKSPESDLSSVRPSRYFEAIQGKNAGLKQKLPYYRAYNDRVTNTGFGIQHGLCARQLSVRREQVYRDESGHLAGLKRVASFRGRISPHNAMKNTFEVSFLDDKKTHGPRIVRIRRSRNPSQVRLDKSQRMMQELESFEQRSRQLSFDAYQ